MNWGLMQAIVEYMSDTHNDFQLVNNTVQQFRQYIYDDAGEYIIGGKQVASFIIKAEKLLTEYSGEVKL